MYPAGAHAMCSMWQYQCIRTYKREILRPAATLAAPSFIGLTRWNHQLILGHSISFHPLNPSHLLQRCRNPVQLTKLCLTRHRMGRFCLHLWILGRRFCLVYLLLISWGRGDWVLWIVMSLGASQCQHIVVFLDWVWRRKGLLKAFFVKILPNGWCKHRVILGKKKMKLNDVDPFGF
jgi:hypothetical protein